MNMKLYSEIVALIQDFLKWTKVGSLGAIKEV